LLRYDRFKFLAYLISAQKKDVKGYTIFLRIMHKTLRKTLQRNFAQDLTTELCARPYNGTMCEGSRRGIIIHYS